MPLPTVGGNDGTWGTVLNAFLGGGFAANRVPFMDSGGNDLTSSANLTFNGTTLTTTTLIANTSISAPSIVTASGALTITPAAGSNLNVALSTTGDFAVNTNDIFVDTSAGFVGIGTTTPGEELDVTGNIKYSGNLYAPAGTGAAPSIRFFTTASGLFHAGSDVLGISTGGGERARITATGNVGIGTTAPPAGGGPSLALAQGTQPTTIGANTAGIWVQDVAGTAELMGFDEAGNDVQLTAHPSNFLNSRTKSVVAWGYSWSNRYEGKRYLVDMGRVIDLLIAAYPAETFLKVEDLPPEKRADWDTDQEKLFQRRLAEQAAWDANISQEKGARPLEYIKKRPQKWMVDRGVKTTMVEI